MTDEEIRAMCIDLDAKGYIPPDIGLEQFIIGTKILYSAVEDPEELANLVRIVREARSRRP